MIIGLGGEPATGKSTIMKYFLGEGFKPIRFGLVYGYINYDKKLVVIGKYEKDNKFPGTDKLSMAVQPHFMKFLEKLNLEHKYNGMSILFEGDRLFNNKAITEIKAKKYKSKFIVLKVSEDVVEFRHKDRKDTQSEIFIKGRRTKYKNILNLNKDIVVFDNNNLDDQKKIIEFMEGLI